MSLEDRVGVLESAFVAEKARVDGLGVEMRAVKDHCATIIGDAQEFREEVGRRFDGVDQAIAELKTDVAELKTDVAEMKTMMVQILERLPAP